MKRGVHPSTFLQNFARPRVHLAFFVFDVLILQGRDVMGETLEQRRRLLEKHVLTRLTEPIHYSPELKTNLADLVHSVKLQGLEGLVAKRRSNRYEPGRRSGAWRKMRVNRGQEFVIGGYTPSDSNFDALIFGYYDGGNLLKPPTRLHLRCRLTPLPRGRKWPSGMTKSRRPSCATDSMLKGIVLLANPSWQKKRVEKRPPTLSVSTKW